jgi:biotin carboxyl carrier protein
MELEYRVGGRPKRLRLDVRGREIVAHTGDREYRVDVERCAPGVISLVIDGRVWTFHTARAPGGIHVAHRGRTYFFENAPEETAGSGAATAAAESDGRVKTPMPGKIVAVNVSEGDVVESNQPLLVLESMKMQNDVLSPVRGRVKKIHRQGGQNVEYGDLLVEIDVAPDPGAHGASVP